MTYANAAATYRQNAILTASPEKLVKMLYDGAIRHLERSRMTLADPSSSHSAAAGESIGKALAIIGELRGSLDFGAGGELAQQLDQLYDFALDQLSQANIERRPEPVEHSLRVMRTLKEGWDAIVPN